MAVEDALHDGLEEGVGATECGEVGRTEVRGNDVEELDGETRGRHVSGGSGVSRARERVYLKEECTRLALLLHALTTTATHILPSAPSSVEWCVPFRSHYLIRTYRLIQHRFRSVLTTAALSHLHMSALASSSRAGSFQNGRPTPHLSGRADPISDSPSRKVSKTLSFFPLRDSYGTTQLVVHTPTGDPGSDALSNLITEFRRIPVESTVLVHGHVRKRPEKQRRPVNCAPLIPLGARSTDSPIGLLSRVPLVMSRFP